MERNKRTVTTFLDDGEYKGKIIGVSDYPRQDLSVIRILLDGDEEKIFVTCLCYDGDSCLVWEEEIYFFNLSEHCLIDTPKELLGFSIEFQIKNYEAEGKPYSKLVSISLY